MSTASPFHQILRVVSPLLKKETISLHDMEACLSCLPNEMDIDTLSADLTRPYSRKVLLNDPRLEVMVARWSPGIPCVPHDHADAQSVILLLKGCAEHKRYQLKDQRLHCVQTEYKKQGERVICAPYQIHAMAAHPELVTLHLYSHSIENMIVYDLQTPSTFVVDGGCGAWLPVEDPKDILAQSPGHVSRKELLQEFVC